MIILGTNSIKDTGYDVDNSLRFNSGSSDYLARTQGTPTSDKIGTISLWLKRSKLGNKRILVNRNDSNIFFFLDFRSDDKLRFATNNESNSDLNLELSCNRVFRDTAAWYHIVYKIDTTQATAGNRAKLYVNGVEETSFLTSTIPAQNTPCYSFVSSVSNGHAIGAYYNGSAYSEFQDGYFAEFCYIDGTALDATSFGEFDEDSGIWKPKNVSGLTFGNNGCYLDFQDASNLGNVVAGNSTDFTENGLTAIDQSTDTCTTNFSTLNPLALTTRQTLSDGNLTGTSSSWSSAISTIAITTGKWFAEVKYVDSTGNILVGVMDEKDMSSLTGSTAGLGFTTNSVGYYATGVKFIADSSSSYGASYTANDIIGIALDLDSGTKTVTFYKNGASQGAINLPTGGTGTFFFAPGIYNGVSNANFGSPSFAISSGNTDGDGYGNFEYAVPSGYFSLCTKNLAEYG